MSNFYDFYSGKGKYQKTKETDMSEEKSGYDRNLDKVIFKEAIKSEKRFLNLEVYSYNNGANKIRIKPVEKNSNPQADPNKKWINHKAISGITVEEAKGLIVALEKAVKII